MSDLQIGLATIVKNEGPYLIDWLGWNRAMGIGPVALGDNVSTDGTSELLAALQDIGEILCVPTPEAFASLPQSTQVCDVITPLLARCDWIAMLDADEFLLPERPETVGSILGRMPEEVGAVLVNWAVFGPNGERRHQPGSPPERFLRRAEQGIDSNRHVKSVFRSIAFSGFLNPHFAACKDGFVSVRPDGTVPAPPAGGGQLDDTSWRHLRINHYIVKSWDEFANKKRSRWSAGAKQRKDSPRFFFLHDRDTVHDPPPQPLIAAARTASDGLRNRLDAAGYGDILRRAEMPVPPPKAVRGAIEGVRRLPDGGLAIRGWAVDDDGYAAPCDVAFEIGGRRLASVRPQIVTRDDLARLHGWHRDCGFRVVLPASAVGRASPASVRAVFGEGLSGV